MASYQECDQSAQFVEEGHETQARVQSKPKQWRRLGLGMAVMCTVGALAYSQKARVITSPGERLAIMHRKIVSAVQEHFSDSADYMRLKASLSITPESLGEDPKLKGTQIRMVTTDDKDSNSTDPYYVFSFDAKEIGDLHEGIEKILGQIKKQMMPGMPDELWQDLVKVESDDENSIVSIVFKPPAAPPAFYEEGDERDAVSSEIDKVHEDEKKVASHGLHLDETITFGKKIEDMVKEETSLATVHGGFIAKIDAKILYAMMSLMDAQEAAAAGPYNGYDSHEGEATIDSLRAIASIGGKVAIQYREETLENLARQSAPNGELSLQQAVLGEFQEFPRPMLKRIAKLRKFARGVNSITMHSVPTKKGPVQVKIEFKKFAITPILKFASDKYTEMESSGGADDSDDENDDEGEEKPEEPEE